MPSYLRCGSIALVLLLSTCGGSTLAQEFVLNDSTFDSWLLSSAGINGPHAGGIDAAFRDQAAMRIAMLEMSCDLSDDQRNRLELAARHDATEFTSRADALRRELVGKSFPHNDINEPYQKIQELGSHLQGGLYGKSSLFHKVRRHVLTSEQLAAADEAEAVRRQRRHEASIGMLITGLEQFTPLRANQRDRLRDLLMAHTKPARRSSQYERYMLLYQLSQVPEEELKKVLDEAQYKSMSPALRNGRAYKQMLEMQGLLDEE